MKYAPFEHTNSNGRKLMVLDRRIDAKDVERAIRRLWFRNARYDGTPLSGLPEYLRQVVWEEAVTINEEEQCTREH